MTDETVPKHRVALVVFATVEAVDAHDAEHVLERMLRDRIGRTGDLHLTISRPDVDPMERDAKVIWMMGAGTALRNGYLDTYPSGQAWRTFGHEDPGPVELQ